MIRSATFAVGLLLALGAFVAYFVLGTVLNPPPYQVLVALQDVPAYSTLTEDKLAVDAQTMSPRVAADLITKAEMDQYLGRFVLETIHAGEPLRKSAITATNNPQAVNRLALILNDPAKVAMVIPVDPKTAPEQIQGGDFVDIVISLAPGNLNQNNGEPLANSLATPTPSAHVVSVVTSTPTARPTITTTLTAILSPEEMNLPAAKVVIQKVPILAVRRERIANPNFAVAPAVGETRSTQPAFISGDIQAVVALVPRASTELLTFALDDGKVHLTLLSPELVQEQEDSATLGVSWSDVIAWMMAERRRASEQVVTVTLPSESPTPTATAKAQTNLVTTPTSNSPLPTSAPNSSVSPPNTNAGADWLGSLTCTALPLGVGILLVVGLVVFIRRARSVNG